MTANLSLLGEAELHGLVDGHIEAARRADVLRRLAASPAERALVEAWQEQGDLIRSAFRDVEHETLPVALDLAPPRLRSIDGAAPSAGAPREPPVPAEHRRSGLAAAATLLVVATGLVGPWMMIAQATRDDDGSEAASLQAASPQAMSPQTMSPQPTLEATLADRAAAAAEPGAFGRGARTAAATSGGGLPTVRIPDLTTSGFTLTSVSTQPSEPASMVLRYSDGGDGRLVLIVARTPQDAVASAPAAVGPSLAWRRRDAAFAIAGTLPADRLRAIAATLQDDAAN